MTVSTADWPSTWSRQHEAHCAFNRLMARRATGGTVELWQQETGNCIGTVPEEVSHKELSVVINAMRSSYERGFADGQAALAKAVLAPINAALQKT